MELLPPYNIIKKFHPDFNLKLFCHNMKEDKRVGSQSKRFQDVIRYYCNEDINENNFRHYAESTKQALALVKDETIFTCICSHQKCIKKCLIQHIPSQEIFLVGSKCYAEFSNRLVSEYKIISKNRNKLLKEQKNKENDYQIIKKMIVNFGKYKGKTFDNIDENYAEYIITNFDKIHKSIKLYYRVVDFFCLKFNLELEV